MRINYDTSSCYLGTVLVAASGRGICAVELGDSAKQVYELLRSRFPKAELQRGEREFQRIVEAVITHLDNLCCTFTLPLDIQGTSFQQRVWERLRAIEPGNTLSYGEIAAQLGRPTAARAVAGACAANRIAVLIPCHRVLTRDRKIGGYRWGTERKKLLLERERR